MNIVYGESHNGRPDGESCGSLVSPDHPNYCEPDDMRLAADDLDTEIVFNVGGYSDCFSPWYRDPQTGW
jgi:hypothetical protein